jgi:hypothetical protein
MTPEGWPRRPMITFRLALYGPDGGLIRTSDAFPVDDPPTAQDVADRCARAADVGCEYQAGTYLIWTAPGTQPPKRIEQAPPPDGVRAFGDDPDNLRKKSSVRY